MFNRSDSPEFRKESLAAFSGGKRVGVVVVSQISSCLAASKNKRTYETPRGTERRREEANGGGGE